MKISLIAPTMIKYCFSSESLELHLEEFNSECDYEVRYDEKGKNFQVDFDYEFTFKVYPMGIIGFQCIVDVENDNKFDYYISKKTIVTNYILDREAEVVKFLKQIDAFMSKFCDKTNYFFNGKYVSYALATYYIDNGNCNLGYSIALKRDIDNYKNQVNNELSLRTVTLDNYNFIIFIWGARVFVSSDNKRIKDYFQYLENENEAQMLWYLITALNKSIDAYMQREEKDVADIEKLLDLSYQILYYKSKFDTVQNSKNHRYELEILQSIVSASKINLLCDSLDKKSSLLKEISGIIERKKNEINQKLINFLLIIISILSSISTIYGFVSVFIENSNKKVVYLVISIFVMILFSIAYSVKNGYIKRKKLK